MIRRDTRWETGIRSRIAVAKIILTAAQIFNKMQHEYTEGKSIFIMLIWPCALDGSVMSVVNKRDAKKLKFS